jgi:hypothetical protein
VKPLHIAVSLRIVAKHRHIPKISLVQAREAIQRVAVAPTQADRLMIEDLERTTLMSISELAAITIKWLPTK